MEIGDAIQGVLALLTVIGLGVTVVYNQRSLRVSRQESVSSTFLQLNERLQNTLYELLERDSQILKQEDTEKLKQHQFMFFRIFDIFADMYQMRPILEEYDKKLWERSEARIRQLARKRAVQILWDKQIRKNPEIFDAGFQDYMSGLLGGPPSNTPGKSKEKESG